MEDLEKQFITSFQSILLKEGKEVCEEILVMIGEKDETVLEKAKAFCEFFLYYKLDAVNTEKLEERCRKYLEQIYNLYKYKEDFKKANRIRNW